jgi:hypothetical protein
MEAAKTCRFTRADGGYDLVLGFNKPGLADHLDANYRRARGWGNLGSSRTLPTIAHASGCASLLLYILLYEVGT